MKAVWKYHGTRKFEDRTEVYWQLIEVTPEQSPRLSVPLNRAVHHSQTER